jgi:very-short-patch-repair endonuclease
MPEFEVNLGGEHWVGRVDALYRDIRLVIELDSRRHHSSLLAQEADAVRDAELVRAGWRVIRIRYDTLVNDPDYVIRLLRDLLQPAAV